MGGLPVTSWLRMVERLVWGIYRKAIDASLRKFVLQLQLVAARSDLR